MMVSQLEYEGPITVAIFFPFNIMLADSFTSPKFNNHATDFTDGILKCVLYSAVP
jgi:hypothetical protein